MVHERVYGVDEKSDNNSDATDSLDEPEVAALAMLALGALDDAESDRAERSAAPALEQQSRRKYEIHPLLGWVIVAVLSLALLLLFWFS